MEWTYSDSDSGMHLPQMNATEFYSSALHVQAMDSNEFLTDTLIGQGDGFVGEGSYDVIGEHQVALSLPVALVDKVGNSSGKISLQFVVKKI